MSVRKEPVNVRFEVKYLVGEATAVRLRSFVRSYLFPHQRSVGQPDAAYSVFNLYLDSEDRRLLLKAFQSPERNLQLRVRYYDNDPAKPVTLHIKRCQADGVVNSKCRVSRPGLDLLLEGQLPAEDPFLRSWPAGVFVAQEFLALVEQFGAQPWLRVAFWRECYESDDDACSVNFDRQIICEPVTSADLGTGFKNAHMVLPDSVLLEVKFTNRFPGWLREMAETFNLAEDEFNKYLEAAKALGV